MKTLKEDLQTYKSASESYLACCQLAENNRAVSISSRETRRSLLNSKIDAAENILMTIQNHFEETMKKMGIYDLYTECTSGQASPVILFKLADETLKLQK